MNQTTRVFEPAFFLRCFLVFVLACSFLINAICRAASYQEALRRVSDSASCQFRVSIAPDLRFAVGAR
jgi:hypothetical protein